MSFVLKPDHTAASTQGPDDRRGGMAWLRRRLKMRGHSRKVAANFGWLLFDRILRMATSIFVGAWIARHLGPANYGELAYVFALIALFQVAASLGTDGPIVRNLASDGARCGEILGTGLRLRVWAGALGWLFAVATVAIVRPGDGTALAMVSIAGAALVFQPAETVDLWFQSQSRSRLSVPYRLVAYIATALWKVALILSDAPLWAFAATALVDALTIALALVVAYRRMPSTSRWKWQTENARSLLVESWPLMISAASIGIYMRIDQIMLREMSGEAQLGLYSAVMPFSQVWHMIPMLLYSSLLPRLAQLYQSDRTRYDVRLQQAYVLMCWAGTVVATTTIVCAPWLVRWLLGGPYLDAIRVLQWHAITNIFVFLGVAQNLAIVIENTPRLMMWKTAIGVAVSLIGNILLVPAWGALGSAWSAGISYFTSVILSNVVLAPNAFKMQARAFLLRYEKLD